jgi:hypothetical protein
MVRGRLGYRTWRAVHWTAYACWPLALVHGIGTGTDASAAWMLVLTAACVGTVVIAIGWRVAAAAPASVGRRLAAGALVVGPVALIVWMALGPLAGNWAARAGTPASMLPSASSTATAATATSDPSSALQAPFTARLSGSVKEGVSPQTGLANVDLRMSMSGGASGPFDVKLVGQPLSGGGVAMSQGSVSLGPPGQSNAYTGQILALHGSRIDATASSAGGAALRLVIDLSIDQAGGSVSGTVQATGSSSG